MEVSKTIVLSIAVSCLIPICSIPYAGPIHGNITAIN